LVEAKVICHQWHKETFLYEIFGPKDTWMKPGYEAAEWGFILYLFKSHSVTRIIRLSITTLWSVIIPPLGVILYLRFLLSTRASEKVGYIGAKYAQNNVDADEDWWYINGTGVNGDLQAANGYHISEIFQKRVRLFYNPTTGLLFDCAQCAVGLISYKTRPSTQLARSLLSTFSNNPTVKVILVVHSMGAIIAANAIKYLIKKGLTKYLYRLELYTFGSPTMEFLHVIDKKTMKRAPFYEHYVNTHDYFGSLGAMRLRNGNWWAVGRVFTCERQGHFFGEHYLTGVSQRAYTWRGSTVHSRLYSYLPDYPTPVPSNPHTVPEYQINPRRPHHKNISSTASGNDPTVSTTPILSPLIAEPIPTTSSPALPTHAISATSTNSTPDSNSPTSTPFSIPAEADTLILPTSDPSEFCVEFERWCT
jgi:hypothetical protein